MALRSFAPEDLVRTLYGGLSSLFVGYERSTIQAWNAAGEVQHTYKGHTRRIKCLLEHAGHLWSASDDKTVRVWNIDTGECIKTIQCQGTVFSLCEWQGNIVDGGEGGTYMWDTEGEQL